MDRNEQIAAGQLSTHPNDVARRASGRTVISDYARYTSDCVECIDANNARHTYPPAHLQRVSQRSGMTIFRYRCEHMHWWTAEHRVDGTPAP